MTPTGVVRMAAYNRWMNERLFEAAGRLPPQALTADRGAFFGSILGTLNHLAVADTLWLHRFAQQRPAFVALAALSAFPRPGSLCDTLGANLHLTVKGDNAHHMVEACFKAVARTLRQALRREGDVLPSTKGVL